MTGTDQMPAHATEPNHDRLSKAKTMLLIRDHGVEDYTEVLDMDTTDVGALSEDDRACLDELGEYLVTTESWQRFAVFGRIGLIRLSAWRSGRRTVDIQTTDRT